MDPGGLKGCRETKLVLLVGEIMEVQSFACTAGGKVGVVSRGGVCMITRQSHDSHVWLSCTQL